MTKLLWWGYKHTSGTYQAKRYFDERDIQDANESDFVDAIVYPFNVPENAQPDTRTWALEHIKSITR